MHAHTSCVRLQSACHVLAQMKPAVVHGHHCRQAPLIGMLISTSVGAPASAGCAATNAATSGHSLPRRAWVSQACPAASSTPDPLMLAGPASSAPAGGAAGAAPALGLGSGPDPGPAPHRNSAASRVHSWVASATPTRAGVPAASVTAGRPIQCAITRHSRFRACRAPPGHAAAPHRRSSRPCASHARCAGEGTATEGSQSGGGPVRADKLPHLLSQRTANLLTALDRQGSVV